MEWRSASDQKAFSPADMAAAVASYQGDLDPGKRCTRQNIETLFSKNLQTPRYIVALARAMGTTAEELQAGLYNPPSDARHEVSEHRPEYLQLPLAELKKQKGLVRIDQFDTGGGMGRSRIVLQEQPGAIRSWEVDSEWVRLNVRGFTSIENLRIVTGFGPSMRPMFNPGDPLLVDIGVKSVTHDGVYFYRIGDDGYIKTLHRVPQDGGGRLLIARSKNIADFPDPVTINEKKMDFHVLAKVLTVWKSEQY